jgi:DoxX-like protein
MPFLHYLVRALFPSSSRRRVFMTRKIVYWACTVLACLALLGSLSYLTGSAEVVQGFAKAGYPQHLRIVLGIAKPIAAIVILLPGLALLKEWAYAGVTFALVMATISAYLSGDNHWVLAFALLVLVAISYFTRPTTRRVWRTRSDDSLPASAVT